MYPWYCGHSDTYPWYCGHSDNSESVWEWGFFRAAAPKRGELCIAGSRGIFHLEKRCER